MNHTVWGKVLLTRPWAGTWLPMKLQFILDAANGGGLSYHHPVQRSYIGNYDFENSRARGRIDLNGLDGMPRTGAIYYPLWNPDDGKFYTSLPTGAMPMEQVLGFWGSVPSGVKKGVFYGDGNEGPFTFHKKIAPYGFLKFSSDQKAFRFIAKTDTGWAEQGVYRIADELQVGLVMVPDWYPLRGNAWYSYKHEWQKYTYQTFGFSGAGVSVNKTVCTPFQWQGYSIWQSGPPFTVEGRQWFYISGASQYGPSGTMRDDGEIYYGSSPYPYPWEINYWQLPRSIRKYRYVLPPPPYGTYLTREIENEILFSTYDSSVSMVAVLDDGADFSDAAVSTFANWAVIKIRCGQPDNYFVRLLAFDHPNFAIVSQIDWRDFPQYEEPGCIRVYNNIPYAVTCLIGSTEPLLLNVLTGAFFDWRSVYLWNHRVYSSYVYGYSGQVGYVTSSCGLPRTGIDGTLAMEYWADDKEEEHWLVEPDVVLQGDVTVINPTATGMYIAAGSVEEVSGCQTDYHKVRATFTIKDTFDNQPVYGAEVTCHVVARIVGQSPVYDQILTGMTDANGIVTFENPSCLYGGTGLDVFEIRFTVTEVFKAGVDYDQTANVLNEVVFTHQGQPQGTFDPDPAQFLSSSPFQQAMSGTYYHVMAAQVPTTNPLGAAVEYNFVCVNNSTLNSGWRNPDNVAGKFNPNGTPQTPEQYWKQVGIKNLLYSWTVQYRIYPNGTTSGVSAAKQITNVLP